MEGISGPGLFPPNPHLFQEQRRQPSPPQNSLNPNHNQLSDSSNIEFLDVESNDQWFREFQQALANTTDDTDNIYVSAEEQEEDFFDVTDFSTESSSEDEEDDPFLRSTYNLLSSPIPELKPQQGSNIIIIEEKKEAEDQTSWLGKFYGFATAVVSTSLSAGAGLTSMIGDGISSVAGYVTVFSVEMILRIELSEEKRTYLMKKCQPFTDKGLPEFMGKAEPIIAAALKEYSGWVPANNSANFLRRALTDIVLFAIGKIQNLIDPAEALHEKLFDISCITDQSIRDHKFEKFQNDIIDFLYLDVPNTKIICDLNEKLKRIAKIEYKEDRNEQLDLLVKEIASHRIAPSERLRETLLKFLNIEDKKFRESKFNELDDIVTEFLSKDVNNISVIIQLQSKLHQIAIQEDKVIRARALEAFVQEMASHRKPERQHPIRALIEKLQSIMRVEDEQQRNIQVADFVDRLLTDLLGRDGKNIPARRLLGRIIFQYARDFLIGFLQTDEAKKDLENVENKDIVNKKIAITGRDWLNFPLQAQVKGRHKVLFELAAHVGQTYLLSSLDKLGSHPRTYQEFQGYCKKGTKGLFKVIGDFLPITHRPMAQDLIHNSLLGLLDWLKDSPGLRAWLKEKLPSLLSFVQGYIQPVTQQIEENFREYFNANPNYGPHLAERLATLLDRASGEPPVPKQARFEMAQELQTVRIARDRVNTAADLLLELVNIGFKDPKTGAINLPVSPALQTTLLDLAVDQINPKKQTKSTVRSLLLHIFRNYILSDSVDHPQSSLFLSLFANVHHGVLQFVKVEIKNIQEDLLDNYKFACDEAKKLVVKKAKPFIAQNYTVRLQEALGMAFDTVSSWIKGNSAWLESTSSFYILLLNALLQKHLEPVLHQVHKNVADHFQQNPYLIEQTLIELGGLLERPTVEELAANNEFERKLKRTLLINKKLDLAVSLIHKWVDVLFTCAYTGKPNLPLANHLQKTLYETLKAPLGTFPLTPVLRNYIILFCPLEPATQEVSEEYEKTVADALDVGTLAGKKFVMESLHDFKTRPDYREQIIDSLMENVLPYLQAGCEEQLYALSNQLIRATLNVLEKHPKKANETIVNCLNIINQIGRVFLPPVFKQMELNAQNDPEFWSRLPIRVKELMERTDEESLGIAGFNKTVKLLALIKYMVNNILGDERGNLPLPTGLKQLAYSKLIAILNVPEKNGLPQKLMKYINKFVVTPAVPDEPNTIADAALGIVDYEAIQQVKSELNTVLDPVKRNERIELAVGGLFDLVSPFFPKEDHQPVLHLFNTYVSSLYAWADTNHKTVESHAAEIIPSMLNFTEEYMQPVIAKMEQNLLVHAKGNAKFAQAIAKLADCLDPQRNIFSNGPIKKQVKFLDEGNPITTEQFEKKLEIPFRLAKRTAEAVTSLNLILDVLMYNLPVAKGVSDLIRNKIVEAVLSPVPSSRALLMDLISRYIVLDSATANKIIIKEKAVIQGLGSQGLDLIQMLENFLLEVGLSGNPATQKLLEIGGKAINEKAQAALDERYKPKTFMLDAMGIDGTKITQAVFDALEPGRQNLALGLRPILHQAIGVVLGNLTGVLATHKKSIREDEEVLRGTHKLVARVNNHIEAIWNIVSEKEVGYPHRHPAVNESEFAYFQDQSVRLIAHLFGPYCSDLPLGKKGQEEVYDLLLEMLPSLLEEQVGKLAVDELLIRGIAGAVLPQKADDAAADIPEGKAIDHPFVDVGGPSFGHAATGRLVVQTGLRVADMAIPGHGSLSNAVKMMRLDKWLGSFIMKKIGSYIEEDASLQSQVLKIAQFGITQLPIINEKILEIDLDKKNLTEEEIALEAAKSAAELKQMKEDLQAKFQDLYSRPISLIDSAVNGPARSVRRAFVRAQARALNWSNNLMVCYDCRWIGQKARFMVGSVGIPAVFSVVGALVTALEAISNLVHAIVEAIYRKTTNMMWGQGWEDAQAKRLMAVLEDKNYKHLLFHLLDDLVNIICLDAAVPSQEAASV